jgi:hypothetical protein
MGTRVPNPYFNKAAIRSADMFFGRTNLLRRFYETLSNRQSISLIGPRQIGKSSLLRCACLPGIQALFDFDLSRHIFVPLDLREYLYKTSDDFFHNVSQEIVLQSHRLLDFALRSWSSGDDEFSNILDQIEEHEFFPVLLLDSFDTITLNDHFGPEFLSFLRAHATAGKVSYVTASIAPLNEVCHRGIVGSPFFNIFYPYALDVLAREDALELIRVPAEKVGMPFAKAEEEWVLKYAGRHPFFIQRLCFVLFEEKLESNDSEIDEQHIKKLAYKDLLPHFQDTWERLTEAQRISLQDEAQQKGNHLRALPELSESAFFRQFVRNTCQIGLFQMTVDELEDALKRMNDHKALGETRLRLMKTVSQRLGKETPPTLVEKGKVIREVLNEAFERLRGPDARVDSAPEWMFYNILYYRYFRHHLKNENIYPRLGFTSIRQYFRERNKAIEALLDILLEMERAPSADE